MSSGLPSARIADTGSRVAEWDYESGASREDRRHRESGLQRGWAMSIVLVGVCFAGVRATGGVGGGVVGGILVPRCSAVRCDGPTSISKHFICDAD